MVKKWRSGQYQMERSGERPEWFYIKAKKKTEYIIFNSFTSLYVNMELTYGFLKNNRYLNYTFYTRTVGFVNTISRNLQIFFPNINTKFSNKFFVISLYLLFFIYSTRSRSFGIYKTAYTVHTCFIIYRAK